ncbi:MAG: orotidine-5'-phosphate decarboxylase [Actinobacteria bacterium]|nr:orotidine-5'-phosphate decarboxylase [Actinomycetota bacterium]
MRAPIAVALDAPDLATMTSWAGVVGPHVDTLKIGLEVYCRDGAVSVQRARDVAPGCRIFLDLKLHDIPATVAGAARAVAPLAPDFLTVHAGGGPAMVAAAVSALPDTRITAVTILTSLDEADLENIGIVGPAERAAVRLAHLAVDAGARAIVCSPLEVRAIRAAVGPEVTVITPGVRPAGGPTQDQARVTTPDQALAWGADLLVIGRPITGAVDPGAAAASLAAGLVHV